MESKIYKIFINIYKQFFIHLRVLFYDLDPVKDGKLFQMNRNQALSPKSYFKSDNSLNYQYLFPFAVGLYTNLDCLYIFYQNNFHYSYNEMPNLFFHLIFQPLFWKQSDIMCVMAVLMVLIVYWCLLKDSMLNPKFLMYLFVDKKSRTVEIITNGHGNIFGFWKPGFFLIDF